MMIADGVCLRESRLSLARASGIRATDAPVLSQH
jgi:hypothetical protein